MTLVKSLIGFLFFVAGIVILSAGLGFVPIEQMATVGLVWPALLILAGILLMLRIRRGSMPILLVAIAILFGLFAFSVGFQPPTKITALSEKFNPNLDTINAKIDFHGGKLNIHGTDEMYKTKMTYTSEVLPFASTEVSGSNYHLNIGETVTARNLVGGYSGSHNWDIGLNSNSPLTVSLSSTGAKADLDMSDTRLASLDIMTSFSLMNIKFGERQKEVHAKINGAFTRFDILIPQSAGLTVNSSIFGSSNLREAGFEEVRPDVFVSKGFDRTTLRIYLDIDAGASAMAISYYEPPK